MGTTANRSYPYPDPTDPADFPGGMQALAEAVDSDISNLVSFTAAPPLAVFSGENTVVPTPGVETNLNFSIVNYSNGAGSITAGGKSITVLKSGTYFLHSLVRAPDVSTILDSFIRVNATEYGRVFHEGDAPAQPWLMVSALVPNISVGELITVTATQNTAGSATFFGTRLTMYKVA